MTTTPDARSTPPSVRPADRSPPPTTVPADDPDPARCPYCERPFATDLLLALHLGEDHSTEVTDAEREAHEAAVEDESDDLFLFHIKVVAGLITLWALFVVAYMVVLGMQG